MKLQIAVAAAILLCAARPSAASDDESALSVSLGYGTYAVPDSNPHGSVLGVDYERGFSDALSFRASGGAGAYYGNDQLTYSGHLVLGITYLFDVIKYVPYANLGLGGIAIFGEEDGTRLSPLVELGVGVDVLHSRTFSYGVQLRFETFLQETSFFTGGLRATWRWGFF